MVGYVMMVGIMILIENVMSETLVTAENMDNSEALATTENVQVSETLWQSLRHW
jgi:hypothetical protein